MQPFISVIIPVYNRAGTIGRCIDSVLAQTYRHLEIIIVDDCSTDDTVKRIKEYSVCNLPLKQVKLKKNSGAQAARNRGIREATGDWIAFQDSDDAWFPEKIEQQVNILRSIDFDPWTVVHTNGVWIDTAARRKLNVQIPVVEGENVYPVVLGAPGPMFQGMLVSQLALQKINYLDENVVSYQEWDTSIRLARHCRFIYLREPLFVYYQHDGETISKDKLRDINGYGYILKKFKDEILRECGEAAWENHLYIQLIKSLRFRLWSEADHFFNSIESKTWKYRLFLLFRIFRISPEPVIRFLRFLRRSQREGRRA